MTPVERSRPSIRFTLGPCSTGRMNGAWWPQDDGLIARELSPLIEELSGRMLLVPARTHRMLATTVMRLAAQMPIVESPKEDGVTAALRIVMAA
ncbi:Uncharacterised protein [Mycobacteroides abscessus subsp. massiliense]|nr:Uncharacterised protein [Mycobacteroides abscessus subsp. bolletii]SKU99044.1 Uncharacterised protein [Mycobacteroides abscessus subsp. bolletii]SLE46681.1 Uncharacterised protein [Mycobacteroides abscessus subsp. massiliense]SLH37749.1 Uncharacterised protein [Mycobacteroides abscessus subsp. massiliense]